MTISPLVLALLLGLYVAAIFGLAWLTRQGRLPARLVNNPLIYVLSLGISVNTWSFYTAVSTAGARGYGYLAYYVGYSLAFLFATVFLLPILQITKTYQLSSMADLFAFRFRSPLAGSLTTGVLLLCIFPLLSLQIGAVAQSARVLLPDSQPWELSLAFCLLALLFTLLFGAGDHAGRDRHQGVVMVLAFETLLKLGALLAVGAFSVYAVFGGFGELDAWLASADPALTRLEIPYFETSTNLVMLLFFTAAIAMPHMFHMTFKENGNIHYLRIASWGIPVLMLLAALPVLPILWAGERLGSALSTEYRILDIGLLAGAPWLSALAFLGGLAGAFGITVVIALALSNMCLNHLVLPLIRPRGDANLYDWLLHRRRGLIVAIILGAWACHLAAPHFMSGIDLGYVSFIACAQFLPGVLTLLYWPTGNRKGFVAGILAGLAVWFSLGLLPLFQPLAPGVPALYSPGGIDWNLVACLSLAANLITLMLVSLCTSTSEEERHAAEMCTLDTFHHPRRLQLSAKTPLEFIERLATSLGPSIARREVLRALKDLGLDEAEERAYPLQQLRDQIEVNLSGLLGPTIANQIIDRHLPFAIVSEGGSLDVSFIESRLESYPGNLSGVALDLDNLRRHHRQVLQDLPLGVCSIGANSEISLWNGAMARLTGLSSQLVLGCYPTSLPEPWKSLLLAFIEDESSTHIHKRSLRVDEGQRWVSLHKATIAKTQGERVQPEGLVIVVEDLTDHELLEAELVHAERLASIGRLAAGVAHEIGNPVTAIACLAQNIRDETADEDLRLMAEQIIEQTRRTSRIVHSLVNFAHSGRHSGEALRETVHLRECAEEAIQLISLNHKTRDITLHNGCDENVRLDTDRQRLQQILVNLLSNARDASAPGSTISVTDSITQGMVSIMITDQGDGIPPEIQKRVFEPFFTTKEPGKGTGLGLALVYSITENLGGTIRIDSPVEQRVLGKMCKIGTRVTVTLPCQPPQLLPARQDVDGPSAEVPADVSSPAD